MSSCNNNDHKEQITRISVSETDIYTNPVNIIFIWMFYTDYYACVNKLTFDYQSSVSISWSVVQKVNFK